MGATPITTLEQACDKIGATTAQRQQLVAIGYDMSSLNDFTNCGRKYILQTVIPLPSWNLNSAMRLAKIILPDPPSPVC